MRRLAMTLVTLTWLVHATAVVPVPCSAQGAAPSRGRFLVFDGLLYRGKPDLGTLGMLPIRGINPPATLPSGAPIIDEGKVRDTLRELADYRGAIYLDWETWDTFHAPPDQVAANIKLLSRVADIARKTAPGARIGFYDVIPCWDYWGLVRTQPAKVRAWTLCNARIAELAQHVDIVMPSLYTFYSDVHGWDVYAKEMLDAARQFHKPVYAFVWPEYHVSNFLLRGQNIPAGFWRHQLEFIKDHADGVVIWGGWQKDWDERAPWWIQTKAFLGTLRRP